MSAGRATQAHRAADVPVWKVLLAGTVLFAILVALGTWQVQRLRWKNDLVETIAARMAAEPVPLAEVLASDQSIADQEYRRVRVEGEFFHHEAERHFLATWQGRSGFFVYTPLRLADGSYLFVNRGFVPYDRKDPQTRLDGQVEGKVSMVGLVRSAPAEKASSILPDNDPEKNVFYWKDIRGMAESVDLPAEADVLGLFVDADATPNPEGLPIGGVTLVDLPNRHLEYALTWYGLAAALVGVLVVWLRTRRRSAA
jgi:surfeit locus 1 family protein